MQLLPSPIRVLFSLLTEKKVEAEAKAGELTAVCLRGAEMRIDSPPALLADLRIEFRDRETGDQFFAKVVERSEDSVRVRFTSVPPSIAASIRELMAVGPEGERGLGET
jgi:hypothetical protein